jgi:hypothetical protein
MKKLSVLRVSVATVIYVALFAVASASTMLHPSAYACAVILLPLLAAPLYLCVASYVRGFGAAALLNGSCLVVGLLAGEGGSRSFVFGLILAALLSESERKSSGYDTLLGVHYSFVMFTGSFYVLSAHWKVGHLSVPMLVAMIVPTFLAGALGMRIAETLLEGRVATLK